MRALIFAISFAVVTALGYIALGALTASDPGSATSEQRVNEPPANRLAESLLAPKAAANTSSAGSFLYQQHCAACHGANLEGQPNWTVANADGTLPAPPHDDSGHTWHHDDWTLFDYTKKGGKQLMAEAGIVDFNSGMPGFAGVLSDTEIIEVLRYIRSLWSENSQAVQSERTRAARDGERLL